MVNSEKRHSSYIVCECGMKILLVPDLKAMNKAIEEHANAHGKTKENTLDADAEKDRITQLLIAKTLKKASEA